MSSKELFYYSYENLLKDIISVAIGYELDRNKAALVKRNFMLGYNNLILKIKECTDKSALHSILPVCITVHEIEKILSNLNIEEESEETIRSVFRLIHLSFIGKENLTVLRDFLVMLPDLTLNSPE